MAGIGAKKGNQYAKGNKGGGRKSAYQEYSVAKVLHSAFSEGVELEELEKVALKVKNGKGKVMLADFILWKAFRSDKVLINLIKKIYPDKIEVPIEVDYLKHARDRLSPEAKKRLEKYK